MNALRYLKKLVSGDRGSVKTRVIRSSLIVGLSGVVGGLLNFARSIVLARLLSPEVFGLMGLAGVAIRSIDTVTRPGIAQALIARTKSFSDAAGTAFSMLVIRGVLLSVVLFMIAPLVAKFYDTEALQPVLQVLSIVFVVNSVANINVIARQKNIEFREVAALAVASNAVGTLLTIFLAFWLRNVWALVAGQVLTAAVNTLLSYYLVVGRPVLAWKSPVARELLTYGKFITASSLVLFVATEIDTAVIGKILGVAQLGFYTMAFALANAATTNISRIASGVLMPAYSELQGNVPGLQRAYVRTLQMVAYVCFPICALMVLLSVPIVGLVYGDKWLPAAGTVQILAMFGLVRAMASFNGYLFEGIGRPDIALKVGVVRLIVVAPLVVWGAASFGIEGVAAAVLAGICVQWLLGLRYLRKSIGITVVEVFRATKRPAASTLAVVLLLTCYRKLGTIASLIELILVIAGSALVYLMINWKAIARIRREIDR